MLGFSDQANHRAGASAGPQEEPRGRRANRAGMAFKKLLGACLLPFPIAVAALLLGLLLLWFPSGSAAPGAC